MTALDLFSGACGGWSLGLHRAGIETVAACEIDPWRQQAFLTNFPGVRMYDDVRALTAARLLADLGELPSVIVGSPPCQDASVANHAGQGVDGDRTGLFFEAIRIVRECKPVWACFENVPGLRARGVERVITGLEEAGYAVWPLVVGAVHTGAPHRRNRVWIVAANASGGFLRLQSGWGGRTDGAGATLAGQHGPAWAAADAGRVGLAAGRLAQPAGVEGACGRESERPVPAWRLDSAAAAADASSQRVLPGTRNSGCGGGPDLAGSMEAGEPRGDDHDPCTGLWDSWNGGFAARSRGMDDGLPRGMARASLAAFGDAVVPQITEAIARTMLRLTA